MFVEQVLIASAVLSGGSVIIGTGLGVIRQKVNIRKYKHYILKRLGTASSRLALDDLEHDDIYNEPILFNYDATNVGAVEPLVQPLQEVYHLQTQLKTTQ